jgi:CheY-like chemotaxis protein
MVSALAVNEPVRATGLRILVVEDHALTAEATATLLRLSGHEVRVAPDGASALRAAQAEPPDVVLLDLGLPGLDGYEVASRLRQRQTAPRPLLIAVTGHGRKAECVRSYEAGIDLHLTKPVSVDELEHFLGRYQAVKTPPARPPRSGEPG